MTARLLTGCLAVLACFLLIANHPHAGCTSVSGECSTTDTCNEDEECTCGEVWLNGELKDCDCACEKKRSGRDPFVPIDPLPAPDIDILDGVKINASGDMELGGFAMWVHSWSGWGVDISGDQTHTIEIGSSNSWSGTFGEAIGDIASESDVAVTWNLNDHKIVFTPVE